MAWARVVLVARSAISWRSRIATMSGCVSIDDLGEVVTPTTSESSVRYVPAHEYPLPRRSNGATHSGPPRQPTPGWVCAGGA